ncbi:glycosyltransferase family 8 protein [Streptomyces sp. NPDC055109]
MYAFGLCVDRNYLTPSLVAVAALADSLTPSARRGTALRVLTLDLTPAHLVLLAHLAKRVGFGSFDAARRSPLRTWRMADSSYISLTTYLRFEFTPAFIRRPYLIYVDADTLVRGDLAAPLHDLRHGEIGAVHDEFNPTVGESPALPGAAERWPHLRGRPYYNAGLLWARTSDLACLRAGVRRALSAHREHILHNDQDALNLWFLHHGHVREADPTYNRFEIGRFLERGDWVRRVVTRPLRPDTGATVIHFVGPEKPWQAACPPTDDVREYRALLRRTMRHVRALGAAHPEPTGMR